MAVAKILAMGIAKELLHLDLHYSAWANRRLLEACSALTTSERMRNLGHSHGGVLFTLQHIYEGERFWSDCVQTRWMPPMSEIRAPDDPPEPRFEELKEAWPAVWSGISRWLSSASEEELAETIPCRLTEEKIVTFQRWQLLRHCVNHSTLHRGQILGMLRNLGRRPPNVDLLTFYVARENDEMPAAK